MSVRFPVVIELPVQWGEMDAFGHVNNVVYLRWFESGRIADGWQSSGPHPMGGVAGGSAQPTTVPMWTVADIHDAVAKVSEAGGTVIQEPAAQPYGVTAECTDDQGARFYLFAAPK